MGVCAAVRGGWVLGCGCHTQIWVALRSRTPHTCFLTSFVSFLELGQFVSSSSWFTFTRDCSNCGSNCFSGRISRGPLRTQCHWWVCETKTCLDPVSTCTSHDVTFFFDLRSFSPKRPTALSSCLGHTARSALTTSYWVNPDWLLDFEGSLPVAP